MQDYKKHRFRQIFYSLISEVRQKNKDEYIKIITENVDKKAVAVNEIGIRYKFAEEKLNLLQIEFEELLKELETKE